MPHVIVKKVRAQEAASDQDILARNLPSRSRCDQDPSGPGHLGLGGHRDAALAASDISDPILRSAGR